MQAAEYRKRNVREWLVRYPRVVPFGIFVLVASVTALAVYAIERGEDQRDRARLHETAQAVSSALERRGSTSSAYLRAGAALFATVDTVEPGLFGRFVRELKLDQDYRGADGVGWAEAVKPAQIKDFERRHGPVTPSIDGQHKWVIPVTYLKPDSQRNRLAIGYNMASEPVRRAAMDEAERTVRPTASGKIVLLQEGQRSSPGFLIYMPVFKSGSGSHDLKGFIYSPFNAQVFLDSALKLESGEDSGIRLYDGPVAPDRLMAARAPAHATGITVTEPVQIANRQMTLQIESAKSDSLSDLSMATLIFGMLVASLLMLVARLMAYQASEDKAALEWLQEQNSIRDSLTRELNHRVKNTLANVLSMIALTRRRATSLEEFAEGIDGRIRALSATHDLLTQSDWGTVAVRSVIEAEVAPYTHGTDRVVTLQGPDVELAPNDALSLGLAIHELATNAAKYGALSAAGGEVSARWTLAGSQAQIIWQEANGPSVPHERKRGFGTDLIEKIVAHELRNQVELDFAPEGVRCVITVPIRKPSDFAMRAGS